MTLTPEDLRELINAFGSDVAAIERVGLAWIRLKAVAENYIVTEEEFYGLVAHLSGEMTPDDVKRATASGSARDYEDPPIKTDRTPR